jgi:hypothetical protein
VKAVLARQTKAVERKLTVVIPPPRHYDEKLPRCAVGGYGFMKLRKLALSAQRVYCQLNPITLTAFHHTSKLLIGKMTHEP